MTKKVALFAWQTVGVTFLDWSIYWLSGNDKFYHEQQGWVGVPADPLDTQKDGKFNAHNHLKNFPRGNTQLQTTINKFDSIDAELTSCCVHLMPIDEAVAQLPQDLSNAQKFQHGIELQKRDLANCFDTCRQTADCDVVVLTLTDSIYHLKDRFLGPKLLTTQEAYADTSEVLTDYFNTFFKESYLHWTDDLKLTAIWDQREFLALTIKPFGNLKFDEYVDYSIPHTYIDARELFFNGKDVILNLMNKLGLGVSSERLTDWLPIYYKWQANQANIMKFSWNLDRICDCIVNNFYYDLSSYQLDLKQEAIIQHVMIYKYGLNFKTWGLEKFPNNTQDLHKLLEPNIHQIDNKE